MAHRWCIKGGHKRLPLLWIQLEALPIGQRCGRTGQGPLQHEVGSRCASLRLRPAAGFAWPLVSSEILLGVLAATNGQPTPQAPRPAKGYRCANHGQGARHGHWGEVGVIDLEAIHLCQGIAQNYVGERNRADHPQKAILSAERSVDSQGLQARAIKITA